MGSLSIFPIRKNLNYITQYAEAHEASAKRLIEGLVRNQLEDPR